MLLSENINKSDSAYDFKFDTVEEAIEAIKQGEMIVIADDGIIVWSQPSGSYNTPNKGDLRHYPDADSPIYKSLIDGNTYSPDTYPDGWEIQE